ncbi:arylesterase [Simiduia agarivorans]|uniref:Acyl-CoA thioesterase I n=1 Tax=Simiduia agarivorans (strain DSM 21679 / JCM 13881 / BCRC 17597 / SA1) TaxID=1117647 RepID=K4KI63_SIMAS|nr:arylesterase [Simiduia agarivorans]AFU97895.1 acyl-CoA thioesterase I [Simiduia agarivorans SA1 = DSM 21679]
MKWFLSLLAGLLLSVSVSAEPAPRLLVLGDSLSAGYGLEHPDQGWVSLMAQDLKNDYKVINASISGDTTAGGLARLPALLDKYSPEILIIELGGNDGLRGYSLATLRQNLSQMVSLGQAAGAEVVVMEIQIPPNYGKRYTEKFTAIFSQVAADKNARLIPFFLTELALVDGMMQADGIHPTAAAQNTMKDQVLDALQLAQR